MLPPPPAYETPGAHAGQGQRRAAVDDEVGDRLRGDRREEDAAPVVAGRVEEARNPGRRPDDRPVVGGGGPEPRVRRLERHAAQRGSHRARRRQDVGGGAGRDPLLVARILERAAGEHTPIDARYDIAAPGIEGPGDGVEPAARCQRARAPRRRASAAVRATYTMPSVRYSTSMPLSAPSDSVHSA